MTNFPELDRRLFDRVIVELDLNVDDFEISLERDFPDGEEKNEMGEAGTGRVTVTYKPTASTRNYRYDVFPPEHLQLEREIKMNLFKTR